MDSPAGSRKGRAVMPKNHLTYDSLRDFLRKWMDDIKTTVIIDFWIIS